MIVVHNPNAPEDSTNLFFANQMNGGNKVPRTVSDQDVTREMLRELWAEVLNDEPDSFKNEDIFFEVGGDSIRAQQLIAAAKKQGIALTMEHIFLNASLEDMSDTIEFITNDENGDTEQTSVLEPFSLLETKEQSLDQIRHVIATKLNVSELAIENAYPCSPMQESLLSESEGTSNLYVRQFVFHINLEANLDQLRQAWNDAITANPVLRTRICYLNASTGFIQAVINEDFEWMVERTSLSSFLKVDARQEMFTGEKFFRYTVVKDQDEDGQEQRHLVWTVHHALCDGASIPEVLDEVARRMKSAVLRPRYSFDGFIKSAVLDIDTQQEEQFWKRMFKSHNPTPFPVVPQAPDFQARPGKAHKCLLTIGQNASRGLTNALLLRAAWAILLSHYTGTENIVFGTIRNGRSSSIPGLATMTGPTISLAPISLHVDSQKTIASFLSGIRVQSAEMMRFEHTGVSKMRKYLANGPSTVMDFQTMLVVHPRRFEDVIAPATQTLGIDYDDSMGKKEEHPYPLVLTCTIDTETEVTLSVQYDERVLHTSQIENLSHHFQALLTQLTYASPDALLGSLSPLSQRDIIQIKEWNKFTPPTEQVCIHELFQRQVERQPEAVAVCSHNQSFTYADVESFSSALAIQLIEVGVIPGQFVAVCFEKSIWTVVSILAVFKAGAVYVPIEPDHPPSRINEVITTTSIKVALASPYGATILKQFCETLITVNSEPTTVEGTLPTVLPSTIAYLLFTSGSTGKPKGILMSHSGICTSIINHGSAFGAGPDWRTLQFGAHTFDLSIGEFFTTLAFGGCICIPSQDGRLNYLADEITNLQANTLMVVPTVANLLFPEDVPTLKTIVLAGEPITKETIVRWANHVNLTAAYGPSETAVYCSGNANVSPDAHPSNIGPAIGGTMWIAHPENHHRLTAIGGVGEIVISGGLLGSGYFNDKSTTDAAFVPAPQWMREMHPGSPFDRIYKSGDLARYNADGTFHIVGRKDTQVKLRGFRIELGEIENQIMASGFVAAALSTLSSKGPCAKQIVAVLSFNRSALADKPASLVTLSKDRHTTQTQSMVDRLRNKLSLLLPEYMVPTIWVVVESMPLLISGKVDRKTIKTWVDSMEYPIFRDIVEGLQRKQGDSGIFPGSLAHTLCQLWSEVLNVPMNQLGMGTSFFAVGGDSIAAIQIVSRAKKLGIPITVRSIISAKTLGNLTTMVEQTHAERGLMPGKSIVDVKRKSITESLQPYQDLLKRKLRQEPSATVIDAYEFAPFQHTAGNLPPIQVVLANAKPEIATFCFPSGQTEPTFDMVGAPEVDECFLPHRALISQSGNRFFIHLQLDHLVIDGWSLKLIKAALLSAYEAEDIYVLEEAPTYKSFVEAHRPDRVQEDLNYWTHILQEQQPSLLSLPPRPLLSKQPLSSRKTVFYLPDIPAEALTQFGVANGLTPASVFDAAWAQTLSAFTSSSDVGFEYVVSGRDEDVSGVFDIVGPLINVLAYHLHNVSSVQDVDMLATLAHSLQEQRSQDSLHKSINIREVVDAVRSEPLFNTAVNFQRRPTAVETETLWVDDDIKKSIDPWHFDVLVRVMHITDDNALRPSFEFDARRFDSYQMTKVAEDFWQRVRQVVA